MAELGTEQSGGIAITTIDPMEVTLLSHMRGHWRGPTLGHGVGTTRSNLVGWGQRCPQDVGTWMVTKMADLGTEQSLGTATPNTVDNNDTPVPPFSHPPTRKPTSWKKKKPNWNRRSPNCRRRRNASSSSWWPTLRPASSPTRNPHLWVPAPPR